MVKKKLGFNLNEEILARIEKNAESLNDPNIQKDIKDLGNLGNEVEDIEIIQQKLLAILEQAKEIKEKYETLLKELEQKTEKIKDLESRNKALAKNLENQRKELDNEKREWRKEEENLRGKSKVDKILILIKSLKDSIIVKNQVVELLSKEETFNINDLNNLQKKIIREFGDYEFFVEDAKACQSKINEILKILTLLFKNADINSMNEFESRSYFKARGILKALHIRLNPFDNHIHSKESRPIELMRIFSVLEPTISSLSGLDTESLETEEYEKVVKSFGDFILEEKQNFMRVYFDESYIDYLDQKVLRNVFVKILTKFILTPEQVLEQMSRWQTINKEFVNKFIEFLRVELTPIQKLLIAENEIKDMKQKGLLN